jgi:hypothetical protein
MNINRKVFFDGVRARVHKGSMTPEQVASYEAILDAANEHGIADARHLAYILATTRGEVGAAMQPVREIGRGKGRKYGKADPVTGEIYYGRGFVQLTWADNYQRMGLRLGIDLLHNPDLALDPKHAARILVIGMKEGLFTGKSLSTYIKGAMRDYVNARRIINGTDRAQEFADFAQHYEEAITAAMKQEEGKGEVKEASGTVKVTKPVPVPDVAPPSTPPTVPPQKPRVSAVQWIIGAIAAALAFIFAWVFNGGPQ